ncbi:NUDIX hydrolase [Streptomyces oceani]|uniref:ATP/GTP-binding protein n=1 Tax=Streptomyces oceani TaxID=1075402 RepID=A0A1E7JXV4_9ACTN|nr:NUDIX hydrolase [Streptomyces oceani]OEU96510.1 ATP/GTP-binding protein [Streptomyces oceani]
MIVWLNGPHGVGKTATARELLHLLPGSTLFEPEMVEDGLRGMLPEKCLSGVEDFRELAAWRRLVADTAVAVLSEVPGPLIAPSTLLRQEHRDEIFGALAARRVSVCHVLLHAEETILRHRLVTRAAFDGGAPGATDGDRLDARATAAVRVEAPGDHPTAEAAPPEPGPGEWHRSQLAAYRSALPWLTADAHLIDTSAVSPHRAAQVVADAVREGAGALDIVQTPEPTADTLAAGVLLFDEDDRVLLVDPTYKPGWEFPGGVVEPGEAPARAGMREVAEELGIELAEVPRLLVLDWEPPGPSGYGGLRLLFDGGLLESGRAADLLLPGAELRGWHFVSETEAAGLLPPVRYRRLRWALRARRQGTTLNLEAGAPVGG